MSRPQDSTSTPLCNTETALSAVQRGFQPVPLVSGDKRARVSGWPKMRWSSTPEGLEEVREKFDTWAQQGNGGIGVLLGEPSGGLIDIDLDHPKTARLKDHFLPRTPMRSGRPSRPNSHYWYIAEPDTLQETRTYKLPNEREDADKRMIVEYRSTGGQTALPGNVHPSGEVYDWGGEPWGGAAGPARVNGRTLALQVSLLGLCTLLVQYWAKEGTRHEAYLALAGGLLRVGEGVHPYWERNAGVVIGAIADATNDDEGPEGRVTEVMGSTLKRIRQGKTVAGFGKLGEIIGEDVVKQARVILAEVESLAGVPPRTSGALSVEQISAAVDRQEAGEEEDGGDGDEEQGAAFRDPLEERATTWSAVDLDPYLTGQVQSVSPEVLERVDGQALLYPGRLNMLYGPSESAKSWIAMFTCLQMMERGERVIYLDFEDEPVNALERMKAIGASYDDLRTQFTYVRPEDPIASMQRSRWGEEKATEKGKKNETEFLALLKAKDPALIVADGMTMLYGLHGLDSNDSVQTDVITTWLKSLTRNGRSTVIVVDHTAKNPSRGSLPIGSQHKVSMVQGTLLQAFPVAQPMPGAVGEVDLIVLKDRPGKVRAASEKSGEKAQLAARVVMDSTSGTSTEIRLDLPKSAPAQGSASPTPSAPTRVEFDLGAVREAERAERRAQEDEAMLALFEGEIGRSLLTRDIYTKLYGDMPTDKEKGAARVILARLVRSGWLTKHGKTQAQTFTLEVSEVEDDKIDLLP